MSKLKHALWILILSLAFACPAAAADGKRILVYGDSNTWGWIPRAEGFPSTRLPDNDRYAGVLAAELGSTVTVVVNGLVGRTMDSDRTEPIGTVPATSFNGGAHLLEAIAAEGPFDLVIVMLGTNDVSAGLQRRPDAVATSAVKLASAVRSADQLVLSRYPSPKVLLVAPPPYGDTSKTPLNGLFGTGETPSRELGAAILSAAKSAGVSAFDAGSIVKRAGGIDGIHMTADDHKSLGKALAVEASMLLK